MTIRIELRTLTNGRRASTTHHTAELTSAQLVDTLQPCVTDGPHDAAEAASSGARIVRKQDPTGHLIFVYVINEIDP